MRNGEAGLVHDLVAIHEQIEVDRPRTPTLLPTNAPQFALDAEEGFEKLPWRERRLEGDGSVEETRLVDDPDRICLSQLRDGDHIDLGFAVEKGDGTSQRRLPLPEVRAEAHVGERH